MTADLALPERMLMLGGDPSLVRDEYLHVIRATIAAHPRSAQKAIGPSEIGTPCQRRLGYRLAGVPQVQAGGSWRPTVGTAVHSWLDMAFADPRWNDAEGTARWLTETKVDVGEIAGIPITGRADLYDRITGTSIDHKCVGITTLRAARAGRVDPKYRVQGHLYGRGWARAGLPIETVAISYLPNNGELNEAHWWSEPYDEAIAVGALEAANTVAVLLKVVPAAMLLPVLATANDHCNWCPWFMPAATDLTEACPGHRP